MAHWGAVASKEINKICMYIHFLPERQCSHAQSFFQFISHADKKITQDRRFVPANRNVQQNNVQQNNVQWGIPLLVPT